MATTATVPAPGFGSALWNAAKSFALLRESVVGMAGTALVLFWAIMALGAPLFAPCDPNATLQAFAKPGTPIPVAGACWTDTFLLGADNIGRDILSRIVWGARTVLTWAPIAAICAYVVGIVLGLAAGYYRGWIDDVLSGVANIILAFPVLVLYILIIATIGASPLNIVFAVTFATGPLVMRIVRGLVLDLRNREYVAAAETRGETAWRIMLIEILPNARGPPHRGRLPAARLRHHHHRRARLPRPRASSPGPGLGRDDQRDAADGARLPAHDGVSVPGHLVADPRLQPDGRRLARDLASRLTASVPAPLGAQGARPGQRPPPTPAGGTRRTDPWR